LTSIVRELPSGTVTFLFTDIEGSTRLLDELGDAYADALAEHRRCLREAFARHSGVEVDTQGDAFFVAFARATDALAAAADARYALESGPIKVRMGVHTGEPLVTDEGYVGIDVHRAARIAAAGHGGQVLVSQTTYNLAGADGLRDLGEHRLKDLSAPERIFQLGEGDFPRLKTLYQTNLPVPATPFLGRDDELEHVSGLLRSDDVRLLTLTGAGGSGKTRLALQSVASVADEYPQGVWWVPLASVRDPAAVFEEAGRTLGDGADPAATIGDRRLLLLLDNFEHVIEAAPGLSLLLRDCPKLDVVVTSRERLQLGGEHVYPVPVLAHADARALFVTRARAVRPDYEADDSVDELCERLDNLPLALELAAARTTILSTEELLGRLGKRLDLLRGGRDAEVRQQTLRATIEWSYDLLAPDEQRLFARLAVFRGGCTLAAAEAVCAADLDGLQSLVDKSLVRVREEHRFWMLETLREFALERLSVSGEEDALRRAHAEFFLSLAEEADLSVEGIESGRGESGYAIVLPEQTNLRAALDWLAAVGEVEDAMRLAVMLEQFWVTNAPGEGKRRMTELLALGDDVPDKLRVRAIRVLAGSTYIAGEFEDGARLSEEALAVYRRLDDRWGIAHMLSRLAIDAKRVGEVERARALIEESLALDSEKFNEAGALTLLGELAFDEGRYDEALELLDRSARLAAEIEFVWWQKNSLQIAAEYALHTGRAADAMSRARESLPIARSIGDRQGTIYGLALLAWAASVMGELDRAGRLWGAIDAEAARGRIGQWEDEREDYASHVVVAAPDFERGYEEGRALPIEDAIQLALTDVD
jgi:predicted ATPase/class 3 adenylate cyclase